MAVSDSQKKATNKYLNKFDDIKIRVPKGKREEYKSYAASRGMSLNNLIIDLIEKDIAATKKLPEETHGAMKKTTE